MKKKAEGSKAEDDLVMLEAMVEQAKISDAMFEKYGIEEEDFNTAMIHYNLENDPKISAVVMQNMNKLGLG